MQLLEDNGIRHNYRVGLIVGIENEAKIVCTTGRHGVKTKIEKRFRSGMTRSDNAVTANDYIALGQPHLSQAFKSVSGKRHNHQSFVGVSRGSMFKQCETVDSVETEIGWLILGNIVNHRIMCAV